jgi:hypothetical protein
MIEEYAYQGAGTLAEVIIDKSFRAILAAKRPRLFAVLKFLQWSWLFKLFGFHLRIQQRSLTLREYAALEFDQVLGTFTFKMNIIP